MVSSTCSIHEKITPRIKPPIKGKSLSLRSIKSSGPAVKWLPLPALQCTNLLFLDLHSFPEGILHHGF